MLSLSHRTLLQHCSLRRATTSPHALLSSIPKRHQGGMDPAGESPAQTCTLCSLTLFNLFATLYCFFLPCLSAQKDIWSFMPFPSYNPLWWDLQSRSICYDLHILQKDKCLKDPTRWPDSSPSTDVINESCTWRSEQQTFLPIARFWHLAPLYSLCMLQRPLFLTENWKQILKPVFKSYIQQKCARQFPISTLD